MLCCPDDHQQAQPVIHPYVAVNATRPKADVTLVAQITTSPAAMLIQSLTFEPRDRIDLYIANTGLHGSLR
jgi:hypothetical protein